MSNSIQPHGLQHARPPCPSPSPGACSNSCPSSQWCYPTISSSVIPFSSCLQSFPASGSFPMSQYFTSCGQSSLSISPSNEYSGLISSRIEWLDLLTVQETLKSLLQYHSSKASILLHSAFFMVQLSHPYFYIFEYIALITYMIWKFVSSILLGVLSFSQCCLLSTKVFSFGKVQFVCFFPLVACALYVTLKYHWLIQGHKYLLYIYIYISFQEFYTFVFYSYACNI